MAGAPFAKVMALPAGTGHEYYLCQQTVQHSQSAATYLFCPLSVPGKAATTSSPVVANPNPTISDKTVFCKAAVFVPFDSKMTAALLYFKGLIVAKGSIVAAVKEIGGYMFMTGMVA
jgi:hypothetical protein